MHNLVNAKFVKDQTWWHSFKNKKRINKKRSNCGLKLKWLDHEAYSKQGENRFHLSTYRE